MADKTLFKKAAIIGCGLIGSSLARAYAEHGIAEQVSVGDISPDVCARVKELGLAQSASTDLAAVVKDADIVMLCVPVGAYADVAAQICPVLKPGSILTDAGSVKQSIIRDVGPLVPEGVHFIPGHPIAGTEHSGPDAGFSGLFTGRWAILTPPPGTDEEAIRMLSQAWERCGSKVEIMQADHHDQVLGITSHLPHLIAYTIVGTATDLESHLKSEVIKFSAGGFRDFTRIAASNPVMWRDIFLNNREAVLDVIQRFTEDLTALQRAIRWGEGEKLEELFTRTRDIRRSVIQEKQDK